MLFQDFLKNPCPFLVRTRKERKETANVPFDHLCDWQRFDGGYERRHPRSRSSRDPSIAALFGNIVPEGAHTARALRLRARASHSQLRPARGVVACASPASTATPFEPCVCAPQQHDESPRHRLGESFGAFLLSEKSTYLLLWQRRKICCKLFKNYS